VIQTKRIIHSIMGKAKVLSAFALIILFTATVTVDSKGPGGVENVNLQSTAAGNGLKGHGFFRDSGVFSTFNAPGASFFTVAFGRGNGNSTGGYVDGSGKLHGFLLDKIGFHVIDFPRAGATFAARININGDIVGAYSNNPNTPAFNLPHGFLLQNGSFITIDIPGAQRTQPFGINNLGQIVGEYVDQNGKSHGFIRQANGDFKTINAPDGKSTIAFDINDIGQIVLLSFDDYIINLGSAYLREANGSDFKEINIPRGSAVVAYGINNNGDIVGDYFDNEDVTGHGFLLSGGVATKIDDPDAAGFTVVYDINDGGQLAGAYDIVTHGYFKDTNGNFTTIDHPLALRVTGEPIGINNLGQIVGAYTTPDELFHGFLRDAGGFTAIDFENALQTYPHKINDNRQVVGYFVDNDGVHGFLFDHDDFTKIDYCASDYCGNNVLATQAFDIDNNGQIVGLFIDNQQRVHGFLRDSSRNYSRIDVQVDGTVVDGTGINGVNDLGQMTGTYTDANGDHAYFRDQTGFTINIDKPGAGFTQPWSIDNNGQIVGHYLSGGRLQGFKWANGSFTTFTNHPGALVQSVVYDIDNLGKIVGLYY
jgi:uncharacterized membrane protein